MSGKGLIIAVAALAFSSSANGALIHTYQLDENPINGNASPYANKTNALDSTGTLHGKYFGNVTTAAGKWGQPNTAARFDGSSSTVIVNTAPVITGASIGDTTVEAFFKVETGYNTGDRFFYAETVTGGGPVMLLRFTGGNLEYGNHNGVGWNFITLSVPTLDPNRWYFVAGVLDHITGEKLYLYDDTHALVVSVGTNAATSHSAATVAKANIGSYDPGASGTSTPSGVFLGTIDDVKIYNSARTAAEVSADAVIPEPSSLALLGGLILPLLRRRH